MPKKLKDNGYGVRPKTEKELLDYVNSLKCDTYDSSAQALADATVAMFNYMSHKMGNTGFQAGWAGLEFLGKVRGMKLPFAIIKAEDMLYPQYDIRAKVEEYLKEWEPVVAEEAKKKLEEDDKDWKKRKSIAHPDVRLRWRQLCKDLDAYKKYDEDLKRHQEYLDKITKRAEEK